jgi:hypothetical protein
LGRERGEWDARDESGWPKRVGGVGGRGVGVTILRKDGLVRTENAALYEDLLVTILIFDDL